VEAIRSITDIPHLEVARQLTLYEFQLFRKISSRELLDLKWTRTDRQLKAPYVMAFISHFGFITSWVMGEILKESDLAARVSTMCHIMHVAIDVR